MKKIVVILVLVLSPFAMGLFAQCDSLKDAVVVFDYNIKVVDPSIWGGLVPTDPYTEPFDTSEKRRIYFVHGLGGNNKAWAKPASASKNGSPGFPRRKCETTLLNYSNNTANLLNATNAIRKSTGTTITIEAQAALDRQQGIIKPSRSIIIAHGQGGLLSRELMHLDIVADNILPQNMDYGGVITIASPLQGAAILDNNRKFMQDWAKDACSKIGSVNGNAPIRTHTIGFLNSKLKPLLDGYCATDSNAAMPMFFNNYYNGITKDYTIGSSMINTLNNDTLNQQYRNFHKMAFYAIEPQENIFWRSLRWMTSNPDDSSCFQANDDWETYNEAKKVIDKLQAEKVRHYNDYLTQVIAAPTLGVAGIALAIFCPASLIVTLPPAINWAIGAAQDKAKYQEYSEALEWFNNANEQWKIIIGARAHKIPPMPIMPHFDPNPPIHHYFVPGQFLPIASINPTPPPTPPKKCLVSHTTSSGDIICMQWNPNYEQQYNQYLIDFAYWEAYPERRYPEYLDAYAQYQIAVKNWKIACNLKPENDGVVLAESAANMPKATHGSVEIYPNKDKTVDKDKGSSHMQVRNDAGLKEHLLKLYNGKYDWWFFVAEDNQ